MCRVYHTVGALSDVQAQLASQKLKAFSSLQELLDFNENFESIRDKLISDHHRIIEEEKDVLAQAITARRGKVAQLRLSLNERTLVLKQPLYDRSALLFEQDAEPKALLKDVFRNLGLWLRIWAIHLRSSIHYTGAWVITERALYRKKRRLKFIEANFDKVVQQKLSEPLVALDKQRAIVYGMRHSVQGAIGEQSVETVLKSLPDDFILINNFVHVFRRPLFYTKKSKIRSVQIDHILVGPPGIFLIETKHWSSWSFARKDFRSPIDQIKRANHALFTLLINARPKSFLSFKKYPWGKKRARIRNVVVFTKANRNYEDGFVDVVTIYDLLSYVKGCFWEFSPKEVDGIAQYLLSITSVKISKR